MLNQALKEQYYLTRLDPNPPGTNGSLSIDFSELWKACNGQICSMSAHIAKITTFQILTYHNKIITSLLVDTIAPSLEEGCSRNDNTARQVSLFKQNRIMSVHT